MSNVLFLVGVAVLVKAITGHALYEVMGGASAGVWLLLAGAIDVVRMVRASAEQP